MKIFLDSVDYNDIKKYDSYGIIDGITTNPSLIASSSISGVSFHELISTLCTLVNKEISVQVTSHNYDNIIDEGKKILSISKKIVIKLPATWDGIRACKYFKENGYRTNITLCFSSSQAIIAAKVGATYISPFIGRLDDIGADGIQLITNIRNIYDKYKIKTKILAASIRTPQCVIKAAICGVDIVTVSAKVLSGLVHNDLTEKGLENFNKVWGQSHIR